MANPTPFLPGYSYSGWQNDNPTKPLPADEVDNDFANIERTTRELIAGLKDVRRSDGALMNQSVGPDQLKPTLTIGFTMRGRWTEDLTYSAGDGVVHGDVFYSARVTNVATAANAPDLAPETWMSLFSLADIAVAGALTMPVNTFVGDGSTTEFTLTFAPLSSSNLFVQVGGVVQAAAEYSTSGSVLNFVTAPPAGYGIEVRGFATTASVLGDETVQTISLADEAVTLEKVAPEVLDRANHTGVQSIATVTGLAAALAELDEGVTDALEGVETVSTALDGKQDLSFGLTSLAALSGGADQMPYWTGTDAYASTALTPFARALLAAANAAAARTELELGSAALSAASAFATAAQGTKADTALQTAQLGAANGVASLDSNGLVPSSMLPASGSYKGTWNASTNSPTITSSVGVNGDFYRVGTAGTTSINGIASWAIGDQIVFNGSVWQKVASTSAVASVAGKTGAVTLVAADISGLGTAATTAATAYATAAQGAKADTAVQPASPALTGNPTAPTQTAGNSSTRLATTAFVQNAISTASSKVEKFGAVGNGSTDDTAAIQSALNAGGVIEFGAGKTYRVTSTLQVQNNTTLEGNGAKISHDTATICSVFKVNKRSFVTIRGLDIDGRRTLKSATGIIECEGITAWGCTSLVIEDCYIHHCLEHGITSANESYAVVTPSHCVSIRNNRIENCGNTAANRGFGIFVFGTHYYLDISGNKCIDNLAGGLAVDDVSKTGERGFSNRNVNIFGNNVKGARDPLPTIHTIGLWWGGSIRGTIGNNTVEGYRTGILVEDSQANSESGYLSVTGNTVADTVCGIMLRTIRETTVSSNTIEALKGNGANAGVAYGILVIPWVSNGTGVFTMRNIQLNDNKIRTAFIGIGTNNIWYNVIADCDLLKVKDNSIVHTLTALGSGDFGIDLTRCPGALVQGNDVSGFVRGININSSSLGCVIRENTSNGNSQYAFSTAGNGQRWLRNTGYDSGLATLNIVSGNIAATLLKDNEFLDASPYSGSAANMTRKNNIGVGDSS